MKKNDEKYAAYVQILKEELVPAMGCTEPIALAYAAAKAREVLGVLPQKVLVEASGSIIKNVKSVIVPNTGHLKGIPAAAAAGIVAGKPEKKGHTERSVCPFCCRNQRAMVIRFPVAMERSSCCKMAMVSRVLWSVQREGSTFLRMQEAK